MADFRLLCIYQHAPTPGAPGIYRHRMLLAELVRRGWKVDLVSSPINYMRGVAPAEYRRRWYVREVIDQVTHHWVRASSHVHRSKGWRAANYASFAAAATARGATLARPDIVWASSPPLSVATVGETLARRFGVPWAFEVRDLWPESAAAVGWLADDSRLYASIERLARRYAREADIAIVPTPALVEGVRKHGASDVHVVPGAIVDQRPDAAQRQSRRRELGIESSTCVFAYVGAHGAANGLDMLIDAAIGCRDLDAVFLLAGDGSERSHIENRIATEAVDNVRLLGPLPKADVAPLLAASDVCLHMLRPDPTFSVALPTKVLEYFSAHRAFITTVPGLPERLARESGGGFAPSVEALDRELRSWAAMSADERMRRGEQAFEYGQQHYGLDATVDTLEAALIGAIEARR